MRTEDNGVRGLDKINISKDYLIKFVFLKIAYEHTF